MKVRLHRVAGLVTLATVLMVVALGIIAAFMLAGLTITQLHLESRSTARTCAQNLAESALCQAEVAIEVSPSAQPPLMPTTFLVGPAVTPGTFPDAPPGSWGVVTFDPNYQLPGLPGIVPWSTSAITSASNISSGVYPALGESPGAIPSTIVAKRTVRLIGTGVCGLERYTVMIVLYWPPFPDCIASSGPFTSTASLFVAGVVNPSECSTTLTSSPNLAPGDIVSNSTASPAICISGKSTIHGSILSVGPSQLGACVTANCVSRISPPIGLPYLNVTCMVHGVKALPCCCCCTMDQLKPIGSMAGGTLGPGFYHATGNMVVSGDLVLKNTIIAVDGSFTSSGGVSGYGSIMTLGCQTNHVGIVLMGTSNLGATDSAKNRVALISKQDIYVGTTPGSGCAPAACSNACNSYFQGLIYTEHNMHAAGITLLGAFVANATGPPCNLCPSPSPDAGQLSVNAVKLYAVAPDASIVVPEEMADCGPPRLGFHGSDCCLLGTLLGCTCEGKWQGQCGAIQVTVIPSPACPLACSRFCICGTMYGGYKPCCVCGKCNITLQVGKAISAQHGRSILWVHTVCHPKFDHAAPAVKNRLMQLLNLARAGPVTCICPAANYSFGTTQDSFLSPSNRVRILLWEPIATIQ